ncbi:hypothetical protein BBJ28_00013547 [Nothophytophthora sp. Chile5]|nr:hypothetical protein BBJ28_00013547 [Nothophytophthora sp. Chile5]
MAQVVGGYHAIALPLPHSAFRRFIYAKEHLAKASEQAGAESVLAPGRTAYLVNLPRSTTDEWLRQCLEPVGAVQHVVSAEGGEKEANDAAGDPLMARTAHVVFKSAESLEKMLTIRTLETPAPGEPSGLRAYVAKYRRNKPGPTAVKEMADRFMATFDADEEEDLRQREELKSRVDDDGFQTVVNTKKRSAVPPEDLAARPAKKQKSKELGNFYRFQTREKKRDRTCLALGLYGLLVMTLMHLAVGCVELKTLRERFEEDRQLVDKMKKANKFRPE